MGEGYAVKKPVRGRRRARLRKTGEKIRGANIAFMNSVHVPEFLSPFFLEPENEAERIFLAGENPRGFERHTPSLSFDTAKKLW